MILSLLYLLASLLVVNFIIGCIRGIWSEGFKKEKFFKGLVTYLLILIGFGAIDMIAYVAGKQITGFTYLAGILLDPIARYFVKLLDTLRELLDYVFGPKKSEEKAESEAKAESKEETGEEAKADAGVTATVIAEAVAPSVAVKTEDVEAPAKRKRGRPRKYPLPDKTKPISE